MKKRTAQSLLYGARQSFIQRKPRIISRFEDLEDLLGYLPEYTRQIEAEYPKVKLDYTYCFDADLEWLSLIWGDELYELCITEAERQVEPELGDWVFTAEFSENGRFLCDFTDTTLAEIREEWIGNPLFQCLKTFIDIDKFYFKDHIEGSEPS